MKFPTYNFHMKTKILTDFQIYISVPLTLKNHFSQRFHFKAKERAWFLLKHSNKDFQDSPPFERSSYFYVTVSAKFERFQYFSFEIDFLENGNIFQKTGVTLFMFSS